MPDIFDLKQLKAEYVPCHELATKFTDNFIRVGDLFVGHWNKVSKHAAYAAKLLVEEKGAAYALESPNLEYKKLTRAA